MVLLVKKQGLRFVIVIKTKYIWLHDLNSLKFVHNFLRHVMYRKAISKLIAIEPRSAIMNFIIHTHLSIFLKKLRVLKQFISYLMKQAEALHSVQNMKKKYSIRLKYKYDCCGISKQKLLFLTEFYMWFSRNDFFVCGQNFVKIFVDSIKYMYH